MARPNPEATEPSAVAEFESDVHVALSELRALVAAVEALPTYPRSAADMARGLNLERNAAWKLFRLIHERDVFVAARFVPGAASIGSFVAGAQAAGVPAATLGRVTEAEQRYARVVRVHAGDRASADIMLGERAGESGELVLRRNAYRSLSYLAGVQARVQLQSFIFAPAAAPGNPDGLDGVSLNGFVDLIRMRSEAPVVIGRAMATDDRGVVLRPAEHEAVDGPEAEGECVPLLKEFCSTPLPRFRRMAGERGFVENEWAEGPVGKTGAATFFAGTVIRGIGSRYANEHNARMDMVSRLRTPTALLLMDVFAHESVFGDATPRVAVYNDLFGDALRRGEGSARYRLPVSPRVERLGRGAASAQTPDIPRYTRMVQHVFDRLGWDSSQFITYRVRVEFPFVPACVAVSFDLLDRPLTNKTVH